MNQISNYLFGKKENEQKCPIPVTYNFSIDKLLLWDHDKDYNTPFNNVNISIKKRISDNKFKVAGFFSEKQLNRPSQGLQGIGAFNVFNFDYWQYIDIFIYYTDIKNDEIIMPPPPNWIEAAHNNGVKIYGTIYFSPKAYGGNIKLVNQLLQKNSSHEGFVGADQLITLAKTYGFDGWYINQETEGGNTETGVFIKEFCKYIQNKSDIEIMWYDSMTTDGTINYQNKLNDLNGSFFQTKLDNKHYNKHYMVSNSMLLNYGWSNDLLNESKDYAVSLNRSPYDIYAGINITNFDFIKKIKGNFENPITSLGLFNASWTYSSSSTYEEFYKKQSKLWSILKEYIPPKSVITKLPFITNFNTGQGQKYFYNGSIISDNEWSDISQQDIMPTWRDPIIKKDHSYVSTDICYSDAYIGGSCIRFDGLIKPKCFIDIDLYKTSLKIEKGSKIIHIFTKRIVNFIKSSIIIHFTNKKYVNLTLSDDIVYNVWTINKFKMMFEDNEIDKILIRFENTDDTHDIAFTLLMGGISIFMENNILPKNPDNLKIINMEKQKYDKDSKKHYIKDKLNLNLTWSKCDNIWYYIIFRCIVSESSNTVEYIGRTSKNIYHISDLIRKENELYSLISVKSIGYDQTVCVNESVIKI
jgi:endo-beta-N-acetylglucosaminidase D